jgi:ribosomal subunit interface protein
VEVVVEILVRSRHLEVSDKFREHAAEKLVRVEKFDPRLTTVDVEVVREQNPRVADSAIKVELTCRGSGPVVRAEASAGDKFIAFDTAFARIEERLRRAADRRRDHHRGSPRAGGVGAALEVEELVAGQEAPTDEGLEGSSAVAGLLDVIGDGPLVVREKEHHAVPMTLADALHHMELVGHDFYLFVDKESRLPSVVYRRKGYDYGVLRLKVDAS